MKKWLGIVCLVVVIATMMPRALPITSAVAAEPVPPGASYEAVQFLTQYRDSNVAQRPEFFDLYSDRAVIHARIQGQDKGLVFQGRIYKQISRQLLGTHQSALDGSSFRQVTVEQRGDRLVIRARRYSTTRCYWDPDYQLGIEKEDHVYRIVEERFTTKQGSACTGNEFYDGGAGSPAGNVPFVTDTSRLQLAAALNGIPPGDPAPAPFATYKPMTPEQIAEAGAKLAAEINAKFPGTTGGAGQGTIAAPVAALPALSTPPAGIASPGAVAAITPGAPLQSHSALWVDPE